MAIAPNVLWPGLVFVALYAIYQGFVRDFTTGWLILFVVSSAFRYLRTIVSIYAFWVFRGRPLALRPRYTPQDVSVVVPTKFDHPEEHVQCLKRILACNPAEVIVVTADPKVALVSSHLSAAGILTQITLISVDRLDKKVQMCAALQNAVKGEIVCFADDDVQWPSPAFLPTMLACFEDESVGAAGPKQRVTRQAMWFGFWPNLCHFLGICYLERRNFNTGSTNYLDGSLSTLSGRTSFYRANIIQNDRFYDYFLNAKNHDDDKNLTRWTFVEGWKIVLQFHPDAIIETSLETDVKGFSNQLMRWARGHWRGNFRVMSSTDYWWRTHTWSLYAIYIGQFQTPAILVDSLNTYFLYMATIDNASQQTILCYWALWLLFTKIVKIIPHFRRYPQDICFIPVMILFSYLHGFINIWALYTLENKGWGAKKAEPKQKEETTDAALTV